MPGLQHTQSRSVRFRPRVPDSERKRVVKACTRCRSRKNRCVVLKRDAHRTLPLCQRCKDKRLSCVFEDVSPEHEDSSGVLKTGTQHSGDTSPQDAPAAQGNASHSSSKAHPSSSHAPLQDNADEAATRPAASSPHAVRFVVKNPHQTHFVGEGSSSTFLAQVQDAVDTSGSVCDDNDQSPFLSSCHLNSAENEILQLAERGLPPRAVADFLLDVFFRFSEANYYYMDRQQFKERLNGWYEGTAQSDTIEPSFLCLSFMVLAMGSQFTDLHGPKLGYLTSKRVPEGGPGMIFYTRAKTLLSDVVTQCSLESIQACFLMGLFLLPSNISDLSYVYHGMALKMAISAGLHRSISDPGLDARLVAVRNRLWWSLYISERRLTIILDRPASIQEDDIDAPLPSFSEELDMPHTTNNIANLLASISLMKIFNRVVKIRRAGGFECGRMQQEHIIDVRKSLDNWITQLPQHLQLDSLDPNMKSFRGAVHLQLNYHFILIYMGRASLLRAIQQHLRRSRAGARQGDDSPPAAQEENTSNDFEQTLIRDCVASAFKMIQRLDYLHQAGRLSRYSFTDMNCCSTAALIIMIHEITQSHPLYQSSIDTAIRAMGHMATGCENAKQGFTLLRRMQRVIAALQSKLKNKKAENAEGVTGAEATVASGYQEWEKWLASNSGSVTSSSPRGLPSTSPGMHEAYQRAHDLPDMVTAAGASSEPYSQWMGHTMGMAGHSHDAATAPQLMQSQLHDTFDIQDAFNAAWPDSLESLGLNGFQDFTFANLQH